jgi:glycosyltransferase involved in cell wall biosynthesis
VSDVCLVLEGTWPYVQGGVSSWVHRIISDMPDIKFTVLSIMPTTADTKVERYEIPGNVQSVINICVHDYDFRPQLFPTRVPRLFELFDLFSQTIQRASPQGIERLLLELIEQREKIDFTQAFSSREFWDALMELYRRGDPSISFLDYFWNYRFTFLPVCQILRSNLPPASVYHTICTGYAGFTASLAKIKFNSNMIVTEHGIYTKERRIEIAQAGWLYEQEDEYVKATGELGYFREWWIGFFSVLSRLAYTYADAITTLFEGNRQMQIADGADPARTSIISNGVDVAALQVIARRREQGRGKRRTLAFMGRIVPIKDVKTLIKAFKLMVQEMPDLTLLIVGPQDEETQYYQECVILIRLLGLEEKVVFTGHVDVAEYYPTIDLLLLTSISEAQPLVVLEAAACGIPTVATDVGSCRELLEGGSEEDRALGSSGIICPFYAPQATAAAAIRLLTDDALYERMARAGRERVARFYDVRKMINAYRNLYEQYL